MSWQAVIKQGEALDGKKRREVMLLAKKNQGVYNRVLREVMKPSQNSAGLRNTFPWVGDGVE